MRGSWISFHVSRETSPNTQPTTTQKPYSEAHTKGSTTSKSSKSSHTSKLIQPLEKSIHANRWQTGKIRHLSYFSLLLKSSHACQCLETSNRISQQLNKIQNQCFTWNTTSSTTTRERVLKNHHPQLNHPTTFHVKHQPPTTNREETTLSNNQPHSVSRGTRHLAQ